MEEPHSFWNAKLCATRYLLGGSACGDAVKCDKQGYVTDGNKNRVVISDQDFLNGTNGVHGSVDANGGVTITTSQGTFQGQFTGSIVQNVTVGVGHDEAVGMMLQDAGRMAQNGVAVTSFVAAPAYLIAAGASVGLSGSVASEELAVTDDALIGQLGRGAGSQRELIGEFFRSKGTEIPRGLSRQTLTAYREIARRALLRGRDIVGSQGERLRWIEDALRRM